MKNYDLLTTDFIFNVFWLKLELLQNWLLDGCALVFIPKHFSPWISRVFCAFSPIHLFPFSPPLSCATYEWKEVERWGRGILMTSQMAPRSAGTKCVRVGLCAVAHPLNRLLCACLIVYNIKYICIYLEIHHPLKFKRI